MCGEKNKAEGHGCDTPRDHPRVCGEKFDILLIANNAQNGITPAYAGKRGSGSPPRSCRQGSPPRVRGKAQVCGRSSSTGSPPRMRGKGSPMRPWGSASRITPAYAGKRFRTSGNVASFGITPACAGKRLAGKLHALPSGSPPRVRGKVSTARESKTLLGSPPHMRGKDVRQELQHSRTWDHPRVCGEKCSSSTITSTKERITPARAGKRWAKRPQSTSSRDHPRACGEKNKANNGKSYKWGSPPRVRGKVSAGKIHSS